MVIRSWQLEVADDKKDHHHLCTLAFIMPEKSKINHFHLYADRLGVELQQVTNKADCKPYLLILLILICKSLIVSLPSRIGTDIFSSFFLTRKQNYFYISSHFSFPTSLLLPFNKKQQFFPFQQIYSKFHQSACSQCNRRMPWSLSSSSCSENCSPCLLPSVFQPLFLLQRNLCRDGSGDQQ